VIFAVSNSLAGKRSQLQRSSMSFPSVKPKEPALRAHRIEQIDMRPGLPLFEHQALTRVIGQNEK
jgi:hypothetical protein